MRRFLVFGLIIAALVLAACGGAETEPTAAVEPTAAAEPTVAPEPTAAPEPTKDSMPAMGEATVMDGKIMLPEVNPLEVTGDVIAAGSSTVFPLAEVLAERFIDEGYGGNITIDSIGSGAGFERFCVAGETDISDASRPIKDSEIESCGKLSPARTPIEFRVGTDALAVVVNPDNDWVGEEGLTLEELAKLFSVDTINWSDVNPDWPAEPIKLFGADAKSGTYDYFKEETVGKDNPMRVDYQPNTDDNVLVTGVAGDKFALGFFGYAYYAENTGKLKAVAIAGKGKDPSEAVLPSQQTIEDGSYSPLSRPLYIYVKKASLARPEVKEFAEFHISDEGQKLVELKSYIKLNPEQLAAAREKFQTALAGSSTSTESAVVNH